MAKKLPRILCPGCGKNTEVSSEVLDGLNMGLNIETASKVCGHMFKPSRPADASSSRLMRFLGRVFQRRVSSNKSESP